MTTAGPGDKETAEDGAARILADAFGYGSNWNATEVRHGALASDADGQRMYQRQEALAIARQGDPEEQAARLIPSNPAHWPQWMHALPARQQNEFAQWSAAHPLQDRRGRLGEFEAWDSVRVEVSVPRARPATRAVVALADAKLTGPLEPMLRAFALEDRQAAETVIRYAVAAGHRREVVLNALVYRIVWPDGRHLHQSTVKQRAAGMREAEYSAAERAAYNLLRGWLHTASVRFMRAHGRVPRVSIPSASLQAVAPKRSRPRFAHGWDSRQQPMPATVIDGWRPRPHPDRFQRRRTRLPARRNRREPVSGQPDADAGSRTPGTPQGDMGGDAG